MFSWAERLRICVRRLELVRGRVKTMLWRGGEGIELGVDAAIGIVKTRGEVHCVR